MSKYDTNSAAAIERRLAKTRRNRQADRVWRAEHRLAMQYASALGSQKTPKAQPTHETAGHSR